MDVPVLDLLCWLGSSQSFARREGFHFFTARDHMFAPVLTSLGSQCLILTGAGIKQGLASLRNILQILCKKRTVIGMKRSRYKDPTVHSGSFLFLSPCVFLWYGSPCAKHRYNSELSFLRLFVCLFAYTFYSVVRRMYSKPVLTISHITYSGLAALLR